MRAGQRAGRLNKTGVKDVRVIGVDGTGQRVKGKGSEGVLVGVDLQKDILLEIELISEDEPEEVRGFIRGLVDRYGVEAVVTDEHTSYEGLEEAVGRDLRHYRCRAHFLRAKLKRLRELKAQMERGRWWKKLKPLCELEEMLRNGSLNQEGLEVRYRQFIHYRSPGVGRRYGLGYKVKLLFQELLDKIGSIGRWTNNTTERLIGLALKFRSKTMRGFKKKENIKSMAQLLFWLWNNRHNCNLALVA